MLLLAFLLLPPPVDAADATPALHRCEATLRSAWGELDLSAWGPSEARAREALEDEAALMAELLRGGPRWAELFPLEGAGGALAADYMLPAPVFALLVPGASLSAPSCALDGLRIKGTKAWTAQWGEGETVSRAHPAHALEAARRRACLPPFRAAVLEATQQLAMSAPDTHDATFTQAWGAAAGALAECWTAAPPELGRGETLPVAEPGLYTCDALRIARKVRDAPLGQGWGDSPEAAADEALRDAALQRYRAGYADALEGRGYATPEVRGVLTNMALQRALGGLGQPSDALDRASLSCRQAELEAPTPLVYAPARAGLVGICDVEDTPWPAPVSQADALPEALDAACDHWPMQVFTAIQASAEGEADQPFADRETPEETADWHALQVSRFQYSALACAASCRSESNLALDWRPVTLAGLPDRSSEAALWALLDEAVAQQDGERLMMAIRDPDAARALAEAPEDTWAAIQENHAASGLRDALQTFEHHGLYFFRTRAH
ncbi:MAG: hypothetical protein H6741_08830 [Alphaproteobacteria bacterium]|nr:hypothetical protein [Alphaproteobacteria bacterium]MCB9792818.1 hypothetical protein [Alphaproteobacteria bacterium]